MPMELPAPKPATNKEDMVWVDCFYYGFYIEKSKVAAYQASLKQPGAKLTSPLRR